MKGNIWRNALGHREVISPPRLPHPHTLSYLAEYVMQWEGISCWDLATVQGNQSKAGRAKPWMLCRYSRGAAVGECDGLASFI